MFADDVQYTLGALEFQTDGSSTPLVGIVRDSASATFDDPLATLAPGARFDPRERCRAPFRAISLRAVPDATATTSCLSWRRRRPVLSDARYRRLRTAAEHVSPVFPFPRCISRDCNANAEQRISTFFARRNVGTRRPLSARARGQSTVCFFSFFFFLSKLPFRLNFALRGRRYRQRWIAPRNIPSRTVETVEGGSHLRDTGRE